VLVNSEHLERRLQLPYEISPSEIALSIQQVYNILHLIDVALVQGGAERVEDFMHPANYSFMLSELIVGGLANHCKGLVKNGYHNGHPDLLPVGVYPDNKVQYAHEGIEVKCSRNPSGWQGHNAEASWMLVAVYCPDTTTEPFEDRMPTFFKRVMLARLEASDWSFAGRREGSRRTPTASILRSGFDKLQAGTVYYEPDLPKLDTLT
jgi:hypothetical protein